MLAANAVESVSRSLDAANKASPAASPFQPDDKFRSIS
ncbi:MAG: hypothetical protein ACI93T_004661, partial [Porticoccaceae bacterium]